MKRFRADGTSLIVECARRLVASSLILYFIGSFAQRAWLLLNSDMGQLIRRVP
jgi:hypothetical protein